MTKGHPGYLLIERAAIDQRVTLFTQDECRVLLQFGLHEQAEGRGKEFTNWLKSKFDGRRKSRLFVQICDMFYHAQRQAQAELAEQAAIKRARELYGNK